MSRLRDSITYCQACRAETFYDAQALRASGTLLACWSCQTPVTLPTRMRLGTSVVILSPDTRLYPHHLDPQRSYDFSTPLAMVTRDPANPALWALRHLGEAPWSCKTVKGDVRVVKTGGNVSLASGMTIDFGRVTGEIRV
ncbi:MAG: hypothetical protein KA506_15825 [Steroidobacteraceae bacterium]|nr:hypothetical protein [Steroidobacteraceae bacterium]MBP6813923.1 hypothetical protein [Burkholderiaceae bacterium]